jgi:toxic protein SymE
MPKERKLKVLPKLFTRRWTDVVFPEIRLAGKWLQDLGFTCGGFVTIAQEENTLIIKMLPEVQVQPVTKEKKCKVVSLLPPEIESVPGDQLFTVWAAEDYNAYVAKVKETKKKKKERSELAKVVQLNTDNPPEPKIADQVADTEAPVIPLHPGADQAADGCNFDTRA